MFWSLVLQEVRALPRGRFGLLAAAGWLTLATLLVSLVLGTEGNSLYSVLVVLYVLPSLALLPITAGYVNSDRSSRFVQSVFTSPVQAWEYLLAKLCPPLVLALCYFLATVPFFVVFGLLAGVPDLVPRFASMAFALTLASICLGGLFGILFVGRSFAAAVGASTAFALFAGCASFLLPIAFEMGAGPSRDAFLAVLHLSPLILALDAWNLHGSAQVASPAFSAAALLFTCAAALATALWIFSRQQAAESWEPTRSGRVLIPLALLTVLLMPAVGAANDYEPTPQRAAESHGNPDLTVLFVRPGSRLADYGSGFQNPFPNGEWARVDLLLLFRSNATLPMRDVRIASIASNAEFRHAPLDIEEPEHHLMSDGRTREVLRMPAEVRFHHEQSLGRMHLIVQFEIEWSGPDGPHEERGDQMVWVHRPDAPRLLAIAGAPGILLCVGAYSARRWKLR